VIVSGNDADWVVGNHVSARQIGIIHLERHMEDFKPAALNRFTLNLITFYTTVC
jgi:hypothetical protein